MKKSLLIIGLLAIVFYQDAGANGILIPNDNELPPLAIKRQRVDIQIKDGAASVKIEQVFLNSTSRDLEAVYVFPLPENAAISDFAMYMNGKRVSGELMDKDKAAGIYRELVRRSKDPALLEHMSGNLFRASVYPVPKNGEQRIELAYSQTIAFDAGLYRFVYPLKTGESVSRTLDDFTVSTKLVSSIPLKAVYSPSHRVGITRRGDHEAIVGFEEEKSALNNDFVLYYSVSKKEFGLNLLTHAVEKEDGFFLMLLAPMVEPPAGEVIRRDIVFVLDSSGSMSGKKITQACDALKYCLNKLNKGDRFAVIRFSTDVEKFNDRLAEADNAHLEPARDFVSKIEARGGTDINGALTAALALNDNPQRQFAVVFLTDGKPTVGVIEMPEILKNLKSVVSENARLFVFGIGDDVNTHLLDRVAGDYGGISQYVKTGEDIEVKVTSFYDKISHPVLAHPRVEIDKIRVRQQHPGTLSDLFAGEQITVFGRYRGEGHVAIRLTGDVNGKKQEYAYEATFPAQNVDNDFIPRLWAVRRVGYLLDQVRLHGEEKELKEEIVRLGNEFGIMTPYTSYIVLEPGKDVSPASSTFGAMDIRHDKSESVRYFSRHFAGGSSSHGVSVQSDAIPVYSAPDAGVPSALKSVAGGMAGRRVVAASPQVVESYLKEESGRGAVELSQAISHYKRGELPQETTGVQQVGRKIFYLVNGTWIDREYRKEMKTVKVEYAGEAYFDFLAKKPELNKYFALGTKMIVCLDADNAIIVE